MVHVSGEIDLATEREFRNAVNAGLDVPAAIVVIDLEGVTFLGSIGIRSLVMAHGQAQQAGRAVRIVEGSPAVRRVMAITGLNQVFDLYRTLDEALSV